MRVLWISNTIFPDPSKTLGLPVPVMGGWMYGLAEQLAVAGQTKLAVASVYKGKELKTLELNNIRYYLLPSRATSRYQQHLESVWQIVCNDFSPDIIHIHGTEFLHGLACMRACRSYNYVISIQGLVGICARYFYAGLTHVDILRNITFRDIVRIDTIFNAKRDFTARGILEVEYIRKTNHVIGRTLWDKTHVKALNPAVTYHFCNETLRDGFYSAVKWDKRKKKDYSIFLSQAVYPIKGLHQVLKAVALLKQDYPYIKVRVAGHSIVDKSTFIKRLKISGYGSYIIRLIKRLNLEGQIEFTGPLTEEEMITEYQNAHLFICPSSIENSPNSIGEAQIVGVPTVAAYVGGIPDMIVPGETGMLYRFEELEMLADIIRQIFTDTQLVERLSRQGIEAAEKRHNQLNNRDTMLEIYKQDLS